MLKRVCLLMTLGTLTGWVAFAPAGQAADAPVPNVVITPAQAAALSPFEEALVTVYQQHPQLEADREQLKSLDEKVSEAAAGFRPSLTAAAGTGYQRESIDGHDWRYGDATAATLTAIQPLFSFGSLAQWKGAKARVEAGRDHLLATEQSVLLTAITAWLDVYEKDRVVGINRDHLARLRQSQSATSQRLQAGEGTATDLAQSDSRVAEAEARLAIAEADAEAARAVYRRDVGLAAPPVLNLPPAPQDLPQNRDETLELARRNPELDAAAYAEDAADHDIDTAESAIWPSIFLRGSMADQRSPDLGLRRERDDSVTINVSVPLYAGGAEYAKIREAKLAKAVSRQERAATTRSVTERADQAWSGYNAANQVAAASQKAAGAAAHMLDGIEEEQKQGTRSLADVLDAKSELLGTQLSTAQAQKNQRLEAYRLLAATGRLTAAHLQLPVTSYDPQAHYDRVAGAWFGTGD